MSYIKDKMKELSDPIDVQIMLCDTDTDTLMLACAMLVKAKTIFDYQIGVEARKTMFLGYTTDDS